MVGFEFVNVTDPREVKKHSTKIRRHVMKDIGKSRRKPKARDRRETKIIDEPAPDANAEIHSLGMAQGGGSEVEEVDAQRYTNRAIQSLRSSGHLSSMLYPFKMNEERLHLARYMVEEARYYYKPFRFAWLSMGLKDPASWYITLANAIIFRGLAHVPKGKGKPEFYTNEDAIKYYARSLESITARIQNGTEQKDDGLVIAVLGCGSVGNFDRMIIHLNGLKRLVHSRGGLEELTDPFLRLMISWYDLSAASYFDSRPTFRVPRGSFTDIDTGEDTKYLDSVLSRWNSECTTIGDITSAIRATAAVAVYINRHDNEPGFWRDDIRLARLLGPAAHEVLSLEGRPLPSSPLDKQYSGVAAREAFRRAALMFLAIVKIHSHAGAWELPKHLNAFRQISQLPQVNWNVVPELNLWAHVVAAMQDEVEVPREETSVGSHRGWHLETIVGIMQFLGLNSGAEAIGLARGIIWADSIMGEKAVVLSADIDSRLMVDMLSRSLSRSPLESHDSQTSPSLFSPESTRLIDPSFDFDIMSGGSPGSSLDMKFTGESDPPLSASPPILDFPGSDILQYS
ncbi:hypothetical protein BX600DRAFT_505255 [Xylariales sp. PMI_506]|nr:hypothetical protein BX600DRAFT_505255 [Xylariales sp. PMI_506]